jgi:hypothetical protein
MPMLEWKMQADFGYAHKKTTRLKQGRVGRGGRTGLQAAAWRAVRPITPPARWRGSVLAQPKNLGCCNIVRLKHVFRKNQGGKSLKLEVWRLKLKNHS